MIPLWLFAFDYSGANELLLCSSNTKITDSVLGTSEDFLPYSIDAANVSGDGAIVTVKNDDFAFNDSVTQGMSAVLYLGFRDSISSTSLASSPAVKQVCSGIVDNIRISEKMVFEIAPNDRFVRIPNEVARSVYAVEPGKDLRINDFIITLELPR